MKKKQSVIRGRSKKKPSVSDLFPERILVTREEDGERIYFDTHRDALAVAVARENKRTVVAIYHREHMVLVEGRAEISEI